MPLDLRKFTKLKEQLQRRQREHDKLQGSLEHIMERLSEEHGIGSVEGGEKNIKKREKKLERMETEIEKEFKALEKEFKEHLDE